MNNRNAQNPNPISLLSLSKLESPKTNHLKSQLCKNHLSFAPSFNTERTENPKSHLYKKNHPSCCRNGRKWLRKKHCMARNGRKWMKKKSCRN
ncbi:hypothetical protein AMTRI_Chr08g167110 [Amborella trichopoda]